MGGSLRIFDYYRIFARTLETLMRLNPKRKTMMHTPKPVAAFIMRISISDIPSKDTTIDLCNVKMDTKASAKDTFRSANILGNEHFLTFIQFIVASVIFVKA